jgi:hypothetical protein
LGVEKENKVKELKQSDGQLRAESADKKDVAQKLLTQQTELEQLRTFKTQFFTFAANLKGQRRRQVAA